MFVLYKHIKFCRVVCARPNLQLIDTGQFLLYKCELVAPAKRWRGIIAARQPLMQKKTMTFAFEFTRVLFSPSRSQFVMLCVGGEYTAR